MVRQPVSFNVLLSGKGRFFRHGPLDAQAIGGRDRTRMCHRRIYGQREAEAKVDKVDVVPQGWGSPTEVFEHALEHERHVSRLIDELVHLASEEKDNATRDFLWGFVREQVEEEANFLNIVNLMKKAGESGILFMDAKLGERQS